MAVQTAVSGTSAVVELLAAGEAVTGSLEDVDRDPTDCRAATTTAPETGVTSTPLDVPELGGDRLVDLIATEPTGAAAQDPAALARLLQQAYEHQHDALD